MSAARKLTSEQTVALAEIADAKIAEVASREVDRRKQDESAKRADSEQKVAERARQVRVNKCAGIAADLDQTLDQLAEQYLALIAEMCRGPNSLSSRVGSVETELSNRIIYALRRMKGSAVTGRFGNLSMPGVTQRSTKPNLGHMVRTKLNWSSPK